MSEKDESFIDPESAAEAGDPGIETKEVDGSVLDRARDLEKAREKLGQEVGEISDEELERILRTEEVEEVDHTREIDTRAIREKHGGTS